MVSDTEEWRDAVDDMSEAERDIDCMHTSIRNGRCTWCGEDLREDEDQ